VHVEKSGLAGVDAFAERLVALVRRAPGNRVGAGEFAIEGIAGGGAGDDRDFEGPAGACAASALGVTLAAPAAVKPLKPIVWPCEMSAAASSGVRIG
jgi:hypothetical protein